MANGPPPSAAGPSQSPGARNDGTSQAQPSASSLAYYSPHHPSRPQAFAAPSNGGNAPAQSSSSSAYQPSGSHGRGQDAGTPRREARSPGRTPSPPPVPFRRGWDTAIKTFLEQAGLTQALKGFELDMLVLNPDVEQTTVASALDTLREHLQLLHEKGGLTGSDEKGPRIPLDERKLDHVHLSGGRPPQPPTQINRSIAQFLARNRARNDASNRAEFLHSLAEKKRRLNVEDGDAGTERPASCARTDAKPVDRDVQMKYDIAKNEDGPLRRTVKAGTGAPSASASSSGAAAHPGVPTAQRHPGLDVRLRNIEAHFAVRYVPAPPRSLLDRLRYLEDHITHLEKECPPWAALHFNQPNRGWPPPPRQTPIIVPSHLTTTSSSSSSTTAATHVNHPTDPSAAAPPDPSTDPSSLPTSQSQSQSQSKAKAKASARQQSSLHRAVMERLEVQKAMKDLAGGDGGPA